MSKIFLKINCKFYSNVTTQPNLWIGLVIPSQHILFLIPSNKDYHSCNNPHSMYQTCP